jgi:hypothetical protein
MQQDMATLFTGDRTETLTLEPVGDDKVRVNHRSWTDPVVVRRLGAGNEVTVSHGRLLCVSERGMPRRFLACLDARRAQGMEVVPTAGRRYAPADFAGMVQAKSYSKRALAQAMERLLNAESLTPFSSLTDRMFKEGLIYEQLAARIVARTVRERP